MKTRLLLLPLLVLALCSCDAGKPPRPQNDREKNSFNQIDKNVAASMLPADRFFEKNANPSEIKKYEGLKRDFIKELKQGIQNSSEENRADAIQNIENKYSEKLRDLQAPIRKRVNEANLKTMEEKNQQALKETEKLLGPKAAAEVKQSQDKMMNALREASAEENPAAAYNKVVNAGTAFKKEMENTVNKYAAQQKVSPEKAAKIYEPYNSRPQERPASSRPAAPSSGVISAKLNPRAVKKALIDNPGSPGPAPDNIAALPNGLSNIFNNLPDMPRNLTEGVRQGMGNNADLFDKITKNVKEYKEASRSPSSGSSGGQTASARPRTDGAAGGAGGGNDSYLVSLPEDKLKEIQKDFDNLYNENKDKIKEKFGPDALKEYKRILDEHSKEILGYASKKQTTAELNAGLYQRIDGFNRSVEDFQIKQTARVTTENVKTHFNSLKGEIPELATAFTGIQNELVNDIGDATRKTTDGQPIIDKNGKIITRAEQLPDNMGPAFDTANKKVRDAIVSYNDRLDKDDRIKTEKKFDDYVTKNSTDVKEKYGPEIAARYKREMENLKQELLNLPSTAKNKEEYKALSADIGAKEARINEDTDILGHAKNLQNANRRYYDDTIIPQCDSKTAAEVKKIRDELITETQSFADKAVSSSVPNKAKIFEDGFVEAALSAQKKLAALGIKLEKPPAQQTPKRSK